MEKGVTRSTAATAYMVEYDQPTHPATASMQTPEAGALVEREVDGDTANLIIQHMKLQEANRVLLAACVNALRDWPIEYMEGDRARPHFITPRCGDRINELRAAIQRAETLR